MSEKTVSYVLRGVPLALWKAARQKAIGQGKTMRQVLCDLLAAWVKS